MRLRMGNAFGIRTQLFGCFLIAFGVKLAILAVASSPVPFADEWDGEAAFLLKPFVEGTLRLEDFFRPHNEHFIPFTRLLTLASSGCPVIGMLCCR